MKRLILLLVLCAVAVASAPRQLGRALGRRADGRDVDAGRREADGARQGGLGAAWVFTSWPAPAGG